MVFFHAKGFFSTLKESDGLPQRLFFNSLWDLPPGAWPLVRVGGLAGRACLGMYLKILLVENNQFEKRAGSFALWRGGLKPIRVEKKALYG